MKTFTLEPTKHSDLFRVVDREGNWEHYALRQHTSVCHGAETEMHVGLKGEIPYCSECKQQCQEVHTYLRGVTTVLGKGYAKGEGLMNFLANHTAEERDRILSEASSRGGKVHEYIDSVLTFAGKEGEAPEFSRTMNIFDRATGKEEPITNKEWDCILSFSRFWEKHEPILLHSEAPLYSETHGYAGTADAFLIITKACDVKMCRCEPLIGKLGLWDWKTAKGIYPDYSAQVASYAYADNVSEYLPPETPVDYVALIRFGTTHVTTGGYQFEAFMRAEGDNLPPKSLQEAFARFIAAKRIADFDYKPFDPATDIQEIPDTFTLAVKHFDFATALAEYEKRKAAEEAKKIKQPRSRTAKKTKKPNVGTRKKAGA